MLVRLALSRAGGSARASAPNGRRLPAAAIVVAAAIAGDCPQVGRRWGQGAAAAAAATAASAAAAARVAAAAAAPSAASARVF